MSHKRKQKDDEKYDDDSSVDDTTESSEVYCICRKELDEEAEWIACDNPEGCPIEWFHIACVGLTADTVPEGQWFCGQCKLKQKTQSAPPVTLFVCEICEEQFTDKERCIKHKQKHFDMYQQSIKEQPSQTGGKGQGLLESQPGTSQSKVLSWEMKSTTSEERATDPMSPQGNIVEEDLDNQSCLSSASKNTQPQISREDSIDEDMVDLDEEKIRILSNFTDEEIIAELALRKEAFVCCCGTVFQDQSLYFLHKGCHNTNNPHKCSFCGFEAKDWYEFTSHFYAHKKNKVVEN